MSNRVLAKNMLFNVASFLLTMGISFFFTPYLIRVLGFLPSFPPVCPSLEW
ncbi:MAG: hypothetical protein ACRC3Z_13335 [Phocaeicola sp.]